MMKENEHVAETRDWTRDLQIFSLTLSQLSYFGLFGVNVQGENVPFNQTTNRKKSSNWTF